MKLWLSLSGFDWAIAAVAANAPASPIASIRVRFMTLPRVSVAAAARTARAPTAEPEGNDTGSARRTLYCGGNSRRRRRAVADRGALLVDGEERRLLTRSRRETRSAASASALSASAASTSPSPQPLRPTPRQ